MSIHGNKSRGPKLDLNDLGVTHACLPTADGVLDQNGQVTAPLTSNYLDRLVTDGSDEQAWLQARARGITATDVAKLTSIHSIPVVALEKLRPSTFTGNVFTEHGKTREPVIAEWVQARTGIEPSSSLFHAEPDPRHLATPDGIGMRSDGVLELAEIKTTGKGWDQIPGNYLRQVFWQQYVLGAQRTFFVWEQHRNFVPIADEPASIWIERDDEAIAELVWLANGLIGELHRLTN